MSVITTEQIKSLRTKTGLSISLCKEALEKCGGDESKAIDFIEKETRSSIRNSTKTASKGIVRCYEHNGSTLGVIVEINCETDSVAKNEEFRAFATNIAMQIASMNPEYVSLENIPKEEIERKTNIFRSQIEDEMKQTGKTKPQQAIDNIVNGKISKWCTDVCLVNQELFTSTTKQTVEQLCNLLSVKFGEKIVIKRFTRYEIG
jgi:elongation factor Ts